MTLPAQRRRRFDRDPRTHRLGQHALAVSLVLALEQIPRRHADDAGLDAFELQLLKGGDAQGHLAAAGQQQQVGPASVGIRQHVGTACDTLSAGITAAVQRGQRLARQHQAGGTVTQGHHDAPGLDDFVRVGRPKQHHAWHCSERRQLLDRLVRGAVLAHRDRVVRPHVDHRQAHHRGQADRAPRVVGEDEEAGGEGAQTRQRHAADGGAHRVLADAEVEVAAGSRRGLEGAREVEGECGLRGRR